MDSGLASSLEASIGKWNETFMFVVDEYTKVFDVKNQVVYLRFAVGYYPDISYLGSPLCHLVVLPY